MARPNFTQNDMIAFSSYSNTVRAEILYTYLGCSERYNMKEVAERVLNDYNDQAGQRISVVTRAFGFSGSNAGDYAKIAIKEDFYDFVNEYDPENYGTSLNEGTFDSFLKPRVEARRRQAEEARRREAERQAELRRLEEEARRRKALQDKNLETAKQAHQSWLREQQVKEQLAKSIAAEAMKIFRQKDVTLEALLPALQRYRNALKITWRSKPENAGWILRRDDTWYLGGAEQEWHITEDDIYWFACYQAACLLHQAGRHHEALEHCDLVIQDVNRIRNCQNQECRNDIHCKKCYALLALKRKLQIYRDKESSEYSPVKAYQAALIGSLCSDEICYGTLAECYKDGSGTDQNLFLALEYCLWYVNHGKKENNVKLLRGWLNDIAKRLAEKYEEEILKSLNAAQADPLPTLGCENLTWEEYAGISHDSFIKLQQGRSFLDIVRDEEVNPSRWDEKVVDALHYVSARITGEDVREAERKQQICSCFTACRLKSASRIDLSELWYRYVEAHVEITERRVMFIWQTIRNYKIPLREHEFAACCCAIWLKKLSGSSMDTASSAQEQAVAEPEKSACCKACGSELRKGAFYCTKCGTKIE